jgi:diguanylate cyclase (GGDEF)-like protein
MEERKDAAGSANGAGALIALWESDAATPEGIAAELNAPRWAAARAADPVVDSWWRYLEAYAAIRAGELDRGAPLVESALQVARAADARAELLLTGLAAFCQSVRGEHEAAISALAAVLADVRGALTPFDRAVMEGNQGTVLWLAGRLQEAARNLMNCLAAMRHEGRRQRVMVTMCNLGQLFVDLGDPASAEDMRRELAAMPETARHPRARAVLPALSLAIGLVRREYQAAMEAAAELDRVYREQGFIESEVQIPPAAAEVCLRMGDLNGAREWLARGARLIDAVHHRRAHALCERVEALIALGAGDAVRARELATRAEVVLAGEPYPLGHTQALETRAECEEAVGDLAAALATRKRHAAAVRSLADHANRSRHYLLETHFRLARLAEERDRAKAEGELHAEHARQLADVNRRLADHLAEVEALRKELAEQAVRDALTGLYNRRRIGEAWPRFAALAGDPATPVFVALLDIDHFKRINDESGHAVGDEVLKSVALALVRAFRGGDLLVRYGGEEFCVVAEAPSAIMLCARLEGMMQLLAPRERRDVHRIPAVTFSAGVARAAPGESFEAVAERADAALYRAKKCGRARVFVAEGAQ